MIQGPMRIARDQVAWRATGSPTMINWVAGTRLVAGQGMRGVTDEVYVGGNEYAKVLFCARFLRSGDLFDDCGSPRPRLRREGRRAHDTSGHECQQP